MLMNHCTCIHKKQHQLVDSIHLLILFFLFLGYVILAYWLLVGQFYQTNEHGYVNGHVIKISPLIQGHITEVLVNENELVIKGQPIAIIDKANAYITLRAAEDNLSASTKKVIEIDQITDELQLGAKTALVHAENHLKQTQEIYKHYLDAKNENVIEQLKQAQISVEKAADSLEDAALAYHAAMSLPMDLDIYQNPIMIESINQLRAAYLNWLGSIVYAPDTGYITKCQVVSGQAVNINTVLMTMVPLNEMWVNININETDLKNIRNGQKARLTSTLYKNEVIYEGTVIGFHSSSTTSSTLFHNAHQKLIRIQINPEQLAQYPLRIGLIMKATINTRSNRDNHLKKIKETPELFETNDYREQLADADQLINKIVQDNTKDLLMRQPYLGKL
jgi:membrane fusion protein, multidrug efflux system